ncbi:hypothetical protein HJP15_12205 [Pseudoalteromonas sp. NEC-BIFX-2020_002]|uniref:hypothetical protein n=1 Tax=Pseudoalteromonas sp. NEC-BIFX-2020_002 TaxID=2732353 RepID=UPI001476AF3E|nr:hypothetical protein [Pseudoalteromonas sp. NEC-BIFX-2020_002]NNG43673.1 hypothetical protein [Pseudoalteromonas sp. NEC-BIFX-2020_002]
MQRLGVHSDEIGLDLFAVAESQYCRSPIALGFASLYPAYGGATSTEIALLKFG